jgi:hypothetical protein
VFHWKVSLLDFYVCLIALLTHRTRGKTWIRRQIALKDGKYLLVVQYIRHGPFRPSMCGALKWQQSQQRATGTKGGIDRSPRDFLSERLAKSSAISPI